MTRTNRTPQDIIIKPVITERAMDNLQQRKYTFRVMKDANKIEIAKAVESLFNGVKVDKVNTMNVRGKKRRQGRTEGYTSSWKKAIITLKQDSKTIEFFDGMV
jgi:large subunit ribosomal protein L23